MKQLNGIKGSKPLPEPQCYGDSALNEKEGDATRAAVAAQRPSWAAGDSAAKAGPETTKVSGGGMGQAFNPKRS